MSLHDRYPALSDLRAQAQRRLPHFVWEFLHSGTGSEESLTRMRASFDAITFLPSILHGPLDYSTKVKFLDETYDLPLGVAPVGMSGLIWPDAEAHLARMAARQNIPYTLSTVASQTPEDLARVLGPKAWFQLYPPRDPEVRKDMLRRARDVGIKTLVFTVDLPAGSRRERQVRSGLTHPPKITPRLLAHVAVKPAWAMGMALHGMPRMRLIDDYSGNKTKGLNPTGHAGYQLRTSPDWDYLHAVRDLWPGRLIIKGVLDQHHIDPLEKAGVDALWVSNHGGRQFDGAPAAIDLLPTLRKATKLPLVFDSGIEGGLDVLRAIALGADLVMLGRGWHYALAALGRDGPQHLAEILKADLLANMGQLGTATFAELSDRLATKPSIQAAR